MGIGRPRLALSRLRVRAPKRTIVPLSVDEVARFWSSFRNTRDLAIVGLMLLQGLRSREVLTSIATISCNRKRSFGCGEKGTRSAFFRWRLNRFNRWIIIFGWSDLSGPGCPFCFSQRAIAGLANVTGWFALPVSLSSPDYRCGARQPPSVPPYLRFGHGAGRQSVCRLSCK